MKKNILVVLLGFLSVQPALAQTAAPIETIAKQAILEDAQTGTVLFAKDADAKMATSSMCKVLTMYLVFEAIKQGKLKLEDTLPVSTYAWQQSGSKMFVKVGDRVRVIDLIRGVVVQSGNDASVVFAEALGGSEANFAELMNAKAKQLGMNNSHFKNATGLPDPDHYSTARDLATLALAIQRDFPEHYHFFSELKFAYNGIEQGNRNPLLYRNIGVDGVKTGHTDAAGFGLIASSVREGRRLVLVVNGLNDMQERADEPARLLDMGYWEFDNYQIIKSQQIFVKAKTWLATKPDVSLMSAQSLTVTLARSQQNQVSMEAFFNEPIEAPIVKGQELGKLKITIPNQPLQEIPLLAGEDIERAGFFERLSAKFHLLLRKN